MAGLNTNGVPRQVLDELFESNRGNLNGYLYRNITRPIKVGTMSGTMAQLPLPQGRVGMQDALRLAEVGVGGDTPKGNSEFSSRVFKCTPAAWAEPVADLARMEAEQYTANLDGLMNDRCAHNVLTNRELRFAEVLKGNGTIANGNNVTVRTLGAGEYFDVYDLANQGASASDVAGFIKTARDATGGGNVVIMGSDIAEALCRHPQITLAFTGNALANTVLSYEQLTKWLNGRGLSTVIISGEEYTAQARELGYSRAEFFTGVFCIMRPNAILRTYMEELQYDSYRDDDKRTDFLRAFETSGFAVPIPEDVYAFKTILTP